MRRARRSRGRGDVWTPARLRPTAYWQWDKGRTMVLGPVTSSGTTPPTVTVSGTSSSDLARYRVEITTGGTLGVAVFRWSSDGSATWTNSVTTGASVVLGTTGVTVAFGAGTYATDNAYVWAPVVSAWADQSGNGYTLAQSTAANRPQVGSTGIVFDGNAKQLSNAALATLPSGTDVPVTMACAANVSQQSNVSILFGFRGTTSRHTLVLNASSNDGSANRRDDASSAASVALSGLTGAKPIVHSHDGTAASVTVSGVTTTGALNVGAATFTGFFVSDTDTNFDANMTLRHMMVFPRALTSSEVTQLNTWQAQQVAAMEAAWHPLHLRPAAMWSFDQGRVMALGPVTAAGTTPPTVTVSGTSASDTARYRVEITTGGARGTALFRWSLDDGTTWTASDVATAASVLLGSTGVTVSFDAGTYAADNVYTWAPVVASWSDIANNGYHLTQATNANRPRVSADAVEFDGSNDVMNATGIGTLLAGTDVPFTVAMAATIPTQAGVGVVWRLSGTGSRKHSFDRKAGSTTGECYRTDDAAATAGGDVGTIGGTGAVIHVFGGTSATTYQNGTPTVTAMDVGACTFNNFQVGSSSVGFSAQISARHVMVFSRALTSAEVTRLNTWLASEASQL